MSDFLLTVNERSLKLLLAKFSTRIEKNIAKVLRVEALPHLVDLVMIGYDRLADRADQLPEDPTNPGNWREEFKQHLLLDLEQTFRVSGTRIAVHIGNKEFLGYGETADLDPTDDRPLQWMVFYLEGLAGDWGFITPADYAKFRGSDSFDSNWGRFGAGFMISREQFDKEGWSQFVSFEQIRHPFSGYAPVDIFREALEEFRLRPFINKAIVAAIKGRDL